MEVTRKIEFDAGHRIPSHKSKCRNAHGHRYVLEVTLEGAVKEVRGESDDGMVVDFGDIKRIAMEKIHDAWDHGFLVYEGDLQMIKALELLGGSEAGGQHKTVILDVIPTAENLAALAFKILDREYKVAFGGELSLSRVRLFETPGCWVDARRP